MFKPLSHLLQLISINLRESCQTKNFTPSTFQSFLRRTHVTIKVH
jgi:hypothetical protein